jgi:hypothetical protein
VYGIGKTLIASRIASTLRLGSVSEYYYIDELEMQPY